MKHALPQSLLQQGVLDMYPALKPPGRATRLWLEEQS